MTSELSPERYAQIDQLFAAALELPEAQWETLLRERCAGDQELHRAVWALLQAHLRNGEFLEAGSAEAVNSLYLSETQTRLGCRVSDYEILDLLGIGGMGQVYLARDQRLNRRVALKILPKMFMQNAERVHRFQLEARAASALNHPNILTIHEIGQHAGVSFIVTEYVEGETLRQRLAGGPLKPTEALDIAQQIASALANAHRIGIVHRDIKPENVMVRPDGLVKVLDFGLAKLLDTPSYISLEAEAHFGLIAASQAGAVRGTPRYMSPEQAGGQEVDGRTDLFSLGVVLYEMLTGHTPFADATPARALTAVLECSPKPIIYYGMALPTPVEALTMRCLEKQPGNRYASARVLAEELKRLGHLLNSNIGEGRGLVSIAVLPFANFSADPANEYFCDGLAEELINALAKIQPLHVVARTSAFAFKGQHLDAREIGRRLNVTTVLEGSVRQSGDRLRITVQLVNVADGYQIWAERYDRQLQDTFTLQDEITLAIIETLKVKLLSNERGGLTLRHPNNPDAYRLFLMGRFNTHKGTGEGFKQAIACYEQAVQLEPTYALARASLANVYFSLIFLGYALKNSAEQCRKALEGALPLDDNLAEVQLARALFKQYHQWDFAGAEANFKRSIELSPNYATAYFSYAAFLAQMTRFNEAVLLARRAEQYDPLSLYASQVLGWVLWYARRYDEAGVQAQKLLEMEPNYSAAYWMRGVTRLHQGHPDEAIADLQHSTALGGGLQAVATLGVAYGLIGKQAEAEKVVAKLLALNEQQPVQSFFLAMVYASLGKYEETFAWLEKSFENSNDVLLTIQVLPVFDPIRADPRYARIVRLVGFPLK